MEIRVEISDGKMALYNQMAEDAGKSLNQFIIDCLEEKANQMSICAIIEEGQD